MEEQAQLGQDATLLMGQLIDSGVVEQENERSFMAVGSKGKQRFSLDKEEQQNL